MDKKVTLSELSARMERFRAQMDESSPEWEMVVIFGKVNQYYFTGTTQEGVLFIPRSSEAEYWVRRSFERAEDESLFPCIRPMESFRDAAASFKNIPSEVYLETEIVTYALLKRFQKYFPFDIVKPVDPQISAVRSVKSDFELSLMLKAGEIHKKVLEERIPYILREGMSEAELATQLYSMMMEEGHHGFSRFAMFDTSMVVGHVCFGESSIYPTFFNGPGGNYGMSPAVPSFGSREHRLEKGDLVFIDVGCGVDGYHTDKTVTYMFGKHLPEDAVIIHQRCVEIQNEAAAMLKPGAIPAEIYQNIINRLDSDFLQNFMGFGNRRVKFLGHGIGLSIDEYPVIAEGFYEPIKEGMAFALEPKKGIRGVGMVGIENTFLVTPEGGKCITGDSPGLIPVF